MESRPEILWLASRHETGPLARPLGPMLDRLRERGFDGRILFLEDTVGGHRSTAHAAPLLKARFLRPLVLRRLWADRLGRRPSLLHVMDDELASLGLELAEIAGIPYVQSITGFATIERGLRLSKRWCRRLAAAGRELACELVSILGVPPQLITVVPPGIDATFDRDSLPDPGQARVVGAVQGTGEQGLMVFLEAARLVLNQGYDVEFVIAGSGAPLSPLRRRLDLLGITSQVTVADHPRAALEIWRILDVFCDPGQGESPNRGLAYALAHGVPSIAADVRGRSSLIDHGRTGLLIPPNSPASLANAIAWMLDQTHQAFTLGQQAQRWARSQFNPQSEADQIAALYREILDQHPGTVPGHQESTAHLAQITQLKES